MTYQDRCAMYERLKDAWLALHPEATHKEIEEAMKRIAKECGI